MQTLGLSSSTPRSESRLKALFWPTIRNEGDVEYISEQGFWVCFIVAALGFVISLFMRAIFAGLFESLFFFLAGIGVRQRSATAGIAAFLAYLLDTLVMQKFMHNGFSVARIIFLALLLANVRGVWQSAKWMKIAPEQPPEVPFERLNDTFLDKLSGKFPAVIWPKIAWLFYIIAVLEIGTLVTLLVIPLRAR